MSEVSKGKKKSEQSEDDSSPGVGDGYQGWLPRGAEVQAFEEGVGICQAEGGRRGRWRRAF